MAAYLALNQFAGTGGVMQVEISFKGNPGGSAAAPYFKAADVRAIVFTPATSVSVSSQYDIALTQVNANTFKTVAAVPLGKVLRVFRMTEDGYPLVDFAALQVVTENDLDVLAKQVVYLVEEAKDAATLATAAADIATQIAATASVTANAAALVANGADANATAALAASAAAVQVANSSISKANAALAAAQSADQHATNVEVLAAAATQLANSANQAATAAVQTANAAASTANGVDAKATAAVNSANNAVQVANSAAATANAVDAKASQALTNANQALNSATAALDTANGVDAKATSAQQQAGNAVTTANAAQAAANGKQTASQALTALSTTTPVAGSIPIWSGPNNASSYTPTQFRVHLGLGAEQAPQFVAVEVQYVDFHQSGDGVDYQARLASVSPNQLSIITNGATRLSATDAGVDIVGRVTATGRVTSAGVTSSSGEMGILPAGTSDGTTGQYHYGSGGGLRGVSYMDNTNTYRIQTGGTERIAINAAGVNVSGVLNAQSNINAAGAGAYVWAYGRVYSGQGNSFLETNGEISGAVWGGALSSWININKQPKYVFQANKVDLGAPAGTGYIQTRINFFAAISNPVINVTMYKNGVVNQYETTIVAIDNNGFTVTYQAQGGTALMLHWMASNPTNV